jgi:putative glutamine amidotransferase
MQRKDEGTMRLPRAANRKISWTPVIGVTASLKDVAGSGAQQPLGRLVQTDLDYVEGVINAGGVPMILPPVVDPRMTKALLDGIDGLLFSGGSDLDPDYYGEECVPELGVTNPERDAFEMALLRLALRRRVPILGICRGMQVLNVALGGTLYQDLPSQLGKDILKHWQETPKRQPAHKIEILHNSNLAEITRCQYVKVNSYHHQGIKEVADSLAVTARSSDGVIEAVEYHDFSDQWLIGVQWHAEMMREAGTEHKNLFEAHVSAAQRHALRRAAA